LLKAENISHSFSYPLFEGLNLEIASREKVAIIGVSGSGKSTLLHILAGTILPNSGTVSHFGIQYQKRTSSEKEKFRREDIGIIFQSHYLFKGFSALENLEVASILSGQNIDYNLIREFGLENLINQKVTELSGGQQQRVSIARILTKKPKIIFADEPTGNLDRETANSVIKTIFKYIDNISGIAVIVTHDESLANRCDKIYKLKDGIFEKIK
jgi:putative ABC transport system ATP-binding protein